MEADTSIPCPPLVQQNVNISSADSSALFCVLCNAPCSCGQQQPPTSHFFFSMGLDGKAVTSPIAIKIIELLVGEINDSNDVCEALSQFPSHVVCRFCFRTLTNLIEEEERLKNNISALKTRLARTLAKHDVVILGLPVPTEELRPPNTPNTMILTKTPSNKPSSAKRPQVIPAQLSKPMSSVKENLISAFSKVETIIEASQNTFDNATSEEASSSSNQDSGQPKAKNLFYTPVAVHECETCSEVFTCKSSLLAHQEQHSNIREDATQNGTSVKDMEGLLGNSSELYRCRLCIQEFSSLEAREQHEKTHKTYLYCKACDVYFKNRDELVEHRTTCQIHSSRFMCEHCGKGFPNSNSLTIHLRTHTGEKPFKCPECDMTFSQVANMRAHVRTTHLQERPHECNLCGRAFKRRRMLENHTRSIHTGERPFQCEVCLASFAYVEHMRKHKLIHSDNKPYVCEICGKGFSNRDNRNTHRFTHTDRKPYECKECGARFLRKPQLLQHLQVSQHGDPETAGAAVKITQVISEPAESDEERPTLSTDEGLESNTGQPQPMSIMISDSDGKPIYVEVMPHSEDVMEDEEETLDSITLEMAQDLVDVTLDL